MPAIYDIETLPNVFTFYAMDVETGTIWIYELSARRNDLPALMQWLEWARINQIEMVGYNNIGFDYPVLHMIMMANGNVTVEQIYEKAMQIITGDRFVHTVWPSDWFIPQIDLYKIHHFDNVSRATSLKALQFAMRSDSVEDMPVAHGEMVPFEMLDSLLSYNGHDVTETKKFWDESQGMVEFRRYLSQKYKRDFMNHNDTKIGKDYFVMELEKHSPGICYEKVDGRRQPRQTPRRTIDLGDVVFPYITFDHPEFNRILDWFKAQTIPGDNIKGFFKDIHCTINDFTFDFGAGGIHGSVSGQTVRSDETFSVIDLDVASYYPNIAIANRVYPEHLSEKFCDIYKDVYEQRKSYKKGTPENAMLKLALNGVYGDSNNKYSPFFDPKYTVTITINGQLLLCVLAEKLMAIPGLTMIQINTDGLTVKVPRAFEWMLEEIWHWWEQFTCLQLEDARYSMMAVADVNNYIAVYEEP